MKLICCDCISIEPIDEIKEKKENKCHFFINHLYFENHNSYFSYIFSLYNISHSFENNKIRFNCLSVQSFKEYLINNDFKHNLPYEEIIKFIYDIGILIKSLEKENKFIFCFSLEDFIIINNSIFIFVNTNKIIHKQSKGNYIQLNYPISTEKELQFISNKIDIRYLPLKCHYSYSYYNLALMVIYLLTGKPYESSENRDNCELLLPYRGTRLYFFLLRCLSDDEKNRCFLYI